MDEIWKSIPGHTNYQVSNLGNVRSIDREIPPGKGSKARKRRGQFIVGSYDKNGYRQVALGANHPKGLTRKVHRLLMMAFVGSSELSVNHIDGNKANNVLENLEYMTHSENHLHARRVLKKLTGDKHWNHKFSTDQIQEMKNKYKNGQVRVKDIKSMFGCSVGYFYELIK